MGKYNEKLDLVFQLKTFAVENLLNYIDVRMVMLQVIILQVEIRYCVQYIYLFIFPDYYYFHNNYYVLIKYFNI